MSQYLRRSIEPRHQYRRWIDPRLANLRLANVIAYLEQRGWKPLPRDREGFLAFQEPSGATVNGKPICQLVPDSENYDNYAALLFELLTGLAEFEDRQASEVIDAIMRLGENGKPNGAALAEPASGTSR